MLFFMRTILATWCFLLFAAHVSAQSPLASVRGKTIDPGLGYSCVRE
jgi:hypothetical protein